MPNRAIKDERRKAGPADPETRRKMLNERLNEREPNRYGKGDKPAAAKPDKGVTSVSGAINAIKDRKYRDRKLLDEA